MKLIIFAVHLLILLAIHETECGHGYSDQNSRGYNSFSLKDHRSDRQHAYHHSQGYRSDHQHAYHHSQGYRSDHQHAYHHSQGYSNHRSDHQHANHNSQDNSNQHKSYNYPGHKSHGYPNQDYSNHKPHHGGRYSKHHYKMPAAGNLCPQLRPPVGGQVSVSGLHHGAIAKYICKRGYKAVPSSIRYCMQGFWTGIKPICRPWASRGWPAQQQQQREMKLYEMGTSLHTTARQRPLETSHEMAPAPTQAPAQVLTPPLTQTSHPTAPVESHDKEMPQPKSYNEMKEESQEMIPVSEPVNTGKQSNSYETKIEESPTVEMGVSSELESNEMASPLTPSQTAAGVPMEPKKPSKVYRINNPSLISSKTFMLNSYKMPHKMGMSPLEAYKMKQMAKTFPWSPINLFTMRPPSWAMQQKLQQMSFEKACPALLPPKNGFILIMKNPHHVAAYKCFPGFALHPAPAAKGNWIRKCLPNGQWSGTIPSCKKVPVMCKDPEIPINGACKWKTNLEGSKLECKCCAQCKLIGSSVRQCMSNGNWSGYAPVCVQNINCTQLHHPINGGVKYNSVAAGALATYFCDEPYYLHGSTVRICQTNSRWSGNEPTCKVKGVTCKMLRHPWNGYISFTNFTLKGSSAIYSCKKGYKMRGTNVRICQSKGKWSGSAPVCQKKVPGCGALADPKNGQVFYSQTTQYSIAMYRCNEGYRLIGQPRRICGSDYQWSGQVPKCQMMLLNVNSRQRYSCPRLQSPENGQVRMTGLILGARAMYRCRSEEYTLTDGDRIRICLVNGAWSGTEPHCTFNSEISTETTTDDESLAAEEIMTTDDEEMVATEDEEEIMATEDDEEMVATEDEEEIMATEDEEVVATDNEEEIVAINGDDEAMNEEIQ